MGLSVPFCRGSCQQKIAISTNAARAVCSPRDVTCPVPGEVKRIGAARMLRKT